jgi:hypothetical protein
MADVASDVTLADAASPSDAPAPPTDGGTVPDDAAVGCSPPPDAVDASVLIADVFKRALISRVYEEQRWTIRDPDGGASLADAATAASALAALRPSYLTGLVYVDNGTTVTAGMIDGFNAIRSAARAQNPNVKLDIEVSLNATPPAPKVPFPSANALVSFMTTLDCQFHPDAWMFDFLSDAQKTHPDWVAAAVGYAHAHGELVGGNVFNDTVPPNIDFVAFVDDPLADGGGFGFDFNVARIQAFKQGAPSTYVVGHLQSNPQNGPTTESCVYSFDWNESKRAAYLEHWATSQVTDGFSFMYPVFYPLCPGAIAFDSVVDLAPDGGTLYSDVAALLSKYNP